MKKLVNKTISITTIFSLILSLILSSVIFLAFPKEAMAQAPTLVGVSAIGASTTGDFTITLPAHQADDILLAISWVRLSTATMATPADWTLMTGTPFVRNTVARYYMFWKRATSSAETNPLFDTSGTDDHFAQVAVFRGADTAGDPWEVKGAASTNTTDPATITGITTLTADSLVVVPVGGEDNNNAAIITTGTDPAAYTETYAESATGTDGATTFSYAVRTTAGATGNVSVDWDVAVPIGWGGMALALKPLVPITTLGTGTDPASVTVAPESGIRDAGAFTFQTNTGTDSVTSLTVILAGAGTPYLGLSEVRITSDDGLTLYFAAISSPASNTLNFSGGTPISVTTTSTQYKIRVTPKTHLNMSNPPGEEYALSPYVSAFTSNNSQAGTDSNANTLTIDNLSPNGATLVSGSAGVQAVTLNWTTSNSSDFNTTSGSVIYRWAAGTAGSEVPAEGSTPSIGAANGTATAACVVSSAASTAQSKIDGSGGSAECTTTALTGGQAYTYKAFQKDTNGNYDVGVLIGTFTPSSSTVVTVNEINTQTSPLTIPSTGNYIGGAFTMLRGTGTANVTSITITESGTVDALNNLNNIKLQYDLDITAPYDCASVSYDALDTQYGVTDTNGFSAANGTSAFTGSVAVSDVQAMCVYVVLDVLSGAGDGQTMIIRINNPSTDVLVSAGTVEPATPQGAGTTTLEVPKITVGTEGTQTTNMAIGVGDNNVGGAFNFTRNTGSANVTQIIITDTGTVNANANISDVIVYYKQEATCSTSIPVDATQFNSTAGSFNVSEKATVTGTMSVGTSKICVYVRVDVGDGATDAQTLEIQIADPSTEVTVSAGSVTPASAVSISGTTTLNLPGYTSQGIPFFYTANNWGTGGSGVSFYLEVYMRQTTGTAYARLYNETDTTAVSGSTLSTTSTSFTRLRTASALTLTNGKTYHVQFGKIGADAGETLGGKLVVNQNGVGGGGGADLAEFYSSTDQLDLAEVVAIDPSKVASVKRSSKPYQSDMLGVVATQPGIILGENVGQSYPIALVGRVPVRVTTENGRINAGDYLTSSSIPGHAMRATKAGRVLGQTLEAFDGANGNTSGTIMVFVNLIDYLGSPVELVMEDRKTQNTQIAGLSVNQSVEEGVILGTSETRTPESGFWTSQNDGISKQQQILAFLRQLKDEQASQSAGITSEIFTDRVTSQEIIGLEIFADTLHAKKIKADSIEGLEIWTDKLSGLSEKISQQATASAVLGTQTESTSSATVRFDMQIMGNLITQGTLTLFDKATFKGESWFEKLVTFLGDIIFIGRPTFNNDTAGTAVISKSTTSIDIAFDTPYKTPPIVTISLTMSEATDSAFLVEGVQAAVAAVTTKGFTIVLNQPIPRDMTYSWVALAISNAKKTEGKNVPTTSPTSTPIATPSATPQPTVAPTPTLVSPTGGSVIILPNELGFVRMRDVPQIEGNEVAEIPSGTILPYSLIQYDWYQVTFDGKTGWVSGMYVVEN